MDDQRTPIFLNTAYVNALINTRDQWHERAVQWERKLAAERRKLLTTEFILIEIGDSLAQESIADLVQFGIVTERTLSRLPISTASRARSRKPLSERGSGVLSHVCACSRVSQLPVRLPSCRAPLTARMPPAICGSIAPLSAASAASFRIADSS